jgi:acetyl-CoA carboxylase carboxyl transferase subunit alpha
VKLNKFILDFEKPILELEQKIEEMRILNRTGNLSVSEEIEHLQAKADQLKREIFAKLNPWERVQLARHPQRPYTLDYISRIVSDFQELHGDRRFADDKAIVAGVGIIGGFHIAIIGQQKGRSTKENLQRNFGMPHPEGYRKALRVMALAGKFGRPVVTLIDTPGAYPGIGAEERGQAEAIAFNLFQMSQLPVPTIAVVIGEGGSGGALALGVTDKVFMLENSIYSVISPEGCASILYRDASKNKIAAEAMKITAKDLLKLKLIDAIIPEPPGGAHSDYDTTAQTVKQTMISAIKELYKKSPAELIKSRREKYRKMGFWETV